MTCAPVVTRGECETTSQGLWLEVNVKHPWIKADGHRTEKTNKLIASALET
jgi:hypothetical protein